MRKIVLFLFVLATVPLASTSILADGPELNLKSPRPTFMRPRMPNERSAPRVTVRITGELEKLDEAENLEEYYCLDEVWDWDDDTESEYAPDCDPYEEGVELKRRFSASHQYRYPGTYQVRLSLQRHGKTVISGTARVMIRS